MDTDKPYIYKQNWGRDLLDRLNNFSNPDGSVNTWKETPTTGPNGEPLGVSHKGYTGVLMTEQPRVERWDGEKWEKILEVPVSFKGEIVPTTEFEEAGKEVNIIYFAESSPGFIFCITKELDDLYYLSRKSVETGEELWRSNIPLLPGNTNLLITNSPIQSSCDMDSSRIYVLFQEQAASISSGSLSVACFNHTGALLWKVVARSPVDSSLLTYSARAMGDALYTCTYIGGPTVILQKFSILNGSLMATLTTDVTLTFFFNNLYVNPNSQNLIIVGRHVNGPVFVTIPASLSLVTFLNNSIVSSTEYGQQYWQDPENPSLIYLYNTVQLKIYRYNSTDNSIGFVCDVDTPIIGAAYGISSQPALTLVSSSGGTIYLYRLDEDNVLRRKEAFFPGGTGSIQFFVGGRFFSQEKATLKIQSSIRGYGSNRNSIVLGQISLTNKRIVSFDDAVILGATNLNPALESNFSGLAASRASIGRGTISTVIAGASTPANSALDPSLVDQNDSGVFVAGHNHLFSSYSNQGVFALGPESLGYTGIGAGISVFGIGANCRFIGGRIVQSAVSLQEGSYIQLFDGRLSKLFFQVVPPTNHGDVLSAFPNGSGLTLTSANNLGAGTESPAFKVQVIGTLSATELRNSGGVVTSDPAMKLNITSLSGEDSWEIINLLDAISFVYKPDFTVTIEEVTQDEDGNETINRIEQHWPLPQGIQIGYNAEQIERTLPELVQLEPKSKIKYLNSGAIAPIVHQGTVWKINQLQQIIEQQQALIESLTARVEALENAA